MSGLQLTAVFFEVGPRLALNVRLPGAFIDLNAKSGFLGDFKLAIAVHTLPVASLQKFCILVYLVKLISHQGLPWNLDLDDRLVVVLVIWPVNALQAVLG
jgi:hypothetical protein